MLGHLYENQDCSAAWTLELVGERWSLLILRDAIFGGFTRFSQFEKALGIAPNILAKRLDTFVDAGLMRRQESDGKPAEYLVTEEGMELKSVIIALTEWGDKWLKPGPAVFLNDGEPVRLEFRRVSDGTRVEAADVVAGMRVR